MSASMHLEVVAGGEPTPAQLAAMIAALAAGRTRAGTGAPASGWLRAAMSEGIGRDQVAAPDELPPGR